MNQEIKVKKGQRLTVTIESMAFGGKGVARVGDFVVFVHGAIPNQKVDVLVIKKKKSFAEARVVEVLEKSIHQVEPRCRHFGHCGGCLLQHFDYDQQIQSKNDQVKDLLQRIGGLSNFEMLPTIPSREIYGYRNKMEFSFARRRWLSPQEIESGQDFGSDDVYLGFHARGFFNKVIDLQECHLVTPVVAEILKDIRNIAKESGLSVYDTSDHLGFWRFVVIRPAQNTGDLMVNVITSQYNADVAEKLKILPEKFPQITSLLNGITASLSSVAFCENEYVLFGESTITEKLGEYAFEISANSFFQTNTKQAEVLYQTALDFAEFRGDEHVYDLYCGAGSISIFIHTCVNSVTGFESVGSAVENARKNCKINHVDNCEFVLADLKDALLDTDAIITQYGKPNTIILDPPRGGMHPKTVKAVIRLAPEKIVHVSCNPATLARELEEFNANGYSVTKVQPVDMFPHTAHIEVVVQLVKK